MESHPTPELAHLQHAVWQEIYLSEKPYQIYAHIPDQTVPRTNLVFEKDGPIIINDARQNFKNFELDKNGFKFVNHEFHLGVLDSEEAIKTKYLPEVE